MRARTEKCGCKSTDSEWTLMCAQHWAEWDLLHRLAQAEHRAREERRENARANPDRIPAPTWCDKGPHPDGLACAECVGTMEHHLIMKGAYGT